MLRSSAQAFARRIHPEALSAMAELFLVSGDMSAWLYTGSQVRGREIGAVGDLRRALGC